MHTTPPSLPSNADEDGYTGRWNALKTLVSATSILDAVRFLLARARRRPEVRLRLALTGSEVVLRPRNSDFEVLMQTFAANGCETRSFAGDPKVVVDAGANIGLTSLLFARHYPKATVVAVEPDEENFRLLSINTASCSNIVPVRAAVWNRHAQLKVRDPGNRSWALQTEEVTNAGESSCAAITLADIRERWGKIDLLKLDIEGAEWPLFETDPTWVREVGVIVVELHGENKEQRLLRALAGLPVQVFKQHEKHVILKADRAEPLAPGEASTVGKG